MEVVRGRRPDRSGRGWRAPRRARRSRGGRGGRGADRRAINGLPGLAVAPSLGAAAAEDARARRSRAGAPQARAAPSRSTRRCASRSSRRPGPDGGAALHGMAPSRRGAAELGGRGGARREALERAGRSEARGHVGRVDSDGQRRLFAAAAARARRRLARGVHLRHRRLLAARRPTLESSGIIIPAVTFGSASIEPPRGARRPRRPAARPRARPPAAPPPPSSWRRPPSASCVSIADLVDLWTGKEVVETAAGGAGELGSLGRETVCGTCGAHLRLTAEDAAILASRRRRCIILSCRSFSSILARWRGWVPGELGQSAWGVHDGGEEGDDGGAVATRTPLGELDLLELRSRCARLRWFSVVAAPTGFLLEPLELVHERRPRPSAGLQCASAGGRARSSSCGDALQGGGRRIGGEEDGGGGGVEPVVVAVEVAAVAAAAAVSVTCRLASSCWTLPSICSICAVCSETAPSISRSWRPMSSMS